MNMGWFSVLIAVGLVVWIAIGQSMKENTCSKCKKLNSLQLIDDSVVNRRDSWKALTRYESNGKQNIKNVPIIIETHKMTFKCKNCGNIEIKYKETEYENTQYSPRV